MLKRTIALGTGVLFMAGVVGVMPALAQQTTATVSANVQTPSQGDSASIIAHLESIIAQLRLELATLMGTSTPSASLSVAATSTQTLPGMQACPAVMHGMGIGDTDASSGGDVTHLQQFLVSTGDLTMPAGVAYGYFGSATEHAVQMWQAKNGIASSGTPRSTGYGFVGPKTRAAIAHACHGPIDLTENGLSASPASGVAPLATTFTVFGESGNYSIDFGDGTSGTMRVDPTFAACGSHCPYSAAHTYQKAGTYTASASYQPQCPAGMLCAQYVRFIGTTTVTVTATDTPPSSESIQSFSVPASITLKTGGIAEDKTDGFYVTITALDSDSATISIVNPYCAGWPSDPPGTIHCMIAVLPIVLTLGTGESGTFQSGSTTYAATATSIGTDQATFSFERSE